MVTSVDVRQRLVEALRLDLVGPRPDDTQLLTERLETAPSRWYLTGFLVPYEASATERSDPLADDELDQLSEEKGGDDEQPPESVSARRAFFPSSIGLSLLVRPEARQLKARVTWGDYRPEAGDEEFERSGRAAGPTQDRTWRRTPRESTRVLDLPSDEESRSFDLPGEPADEGLRLVVSVRIVRGSSARRLPAGTRAVSVFLVNHRRPAPNPERDTAFAFQAQLELTSPDPLVPRPDPRRGESDPDEGLAALQYRDAVEYAVGHNVSALAVRHENQRCHQVRTAWQPQAEVEKTAHGKAGGASITMEALARESAEEILERLEPMFNAYATWIDGQRTKATEELKDEPEDFRRTSAEILNRAEVARRRMQQGLEALEDPQVLEAFHVANRAVARALRQGIAQDKGIEPGSVDPPRWRPFQLAFLLMNVPGLSDPGHDDREVVDLLFFPTGGGKTEAYLGLAAFTLALRRLRHPGLGGAGLSVLMRYTLRLLTLDQLGRAARLVCALELERQQDPEKLGSWPFEIGLWVGRSATPNRMGKKGERDDQSARSRTLRFQRDDRRYPSPIPLEDCPWCGTKFTRDSFKLLPTSDEPEDLRISCRSRSCEFHIRRQRLGLPILAVDEPIYRRLPAFLIATVDKFANLPWVGASGALFGRVERADQRGFYGPGERPGRRLDGPLPPPDLVIQDELHLISGPLGTMVGLYETAIDALSGDPADPRSRARPKIVASTATVRRAHKQIQALFGRREVDVFPPPGPDRRDSFFAQTVPSAEENARLYVGVAALGRNLKVSLLRVYVALLGAAQKAWQDEGPPTGDHPADPYMTLLGYFNSLRELGGSRRIVADEVASRLQAIDGRRRVGEARGLFANRRLRDPEELTSREDTAKVAKTKQLLAKPFAQDAELDVVLATNMISVGLDIQRLGLMVVLGQPKTAAEYIQATSRVGRDVDRPGLVVTLLNVHRPRDRSHYERFTAWHESFYRAVEATSVTPFSPRAVDRGLAGITVALARLGHAPLTPPRQAVDLPRQRTSVDFVAENISRRGEGHDKDLERQEKEDLRQLLRGRVVDLLDEWSRLASEPGGLQYGNEAGVEPPLLRAPTDPELPRLPARKRKFKAPRSLRDVEPTVNLWVRNPEGFADDA